MNLLSMALKSAKFRRTSLLLTVVSIAISVTLLLGVDMVRKQARGSFLNTVSQTDLVVGARSGPTNLLLYSVFRIGNATNNVSWETYETIAAMDEVAWTIPISLGDSHRGFRVMGTTGEYFEHYGYGNNRSLTFEIGEPFAEVYETVLGADVARSLGYEIGDELLISHGLVSADFANHDDKRSRWSASSTRRGHRWTAPSTSAWPGSKPSTSIGRTGRDRRSPSTPNRPQVRPDPNGHHRVHGRVGEPGADLPVQREINEFRGEPMSAILPGQRWPSSADDIGGRTGAVRDLRLRPGRRIPGHVDHAPVHAERATPRDRRAAGHRARAAHVVVLIVLETLLVVTAGCLLGVALLYGVVAAARPIVTSRFGLDIGLAWLDPTQLSILGGVILGSVLVGLIPGLVAYRRSIQDGLHKV